MSALARAQHPHHPPHPGAGSVEAFLAWEREQAGRHEYVAGRSTRWWGPAWRTAGSCSTGEDPRRGGRAGALRGLHLWRRLGVGDAVFYPDVMVSCEGVDLDGDVLGAPVLTAEVLSPSTEVFADVYAGLDELVAGL